MKKKFHMIRYGTHAESRYLSGDFLPTYDLLVVNGNMAAYSYAAMARFIAVQAQNKQYIIDPQTHAFQHDLRFIKSTATNEIKSSISRLMEYFGEPLKTIITEKNRPVSPDDFKNKDTLLDMVEKVIEFQKKIFAEQEGDWNKYYEYLNIIPLKPWALIPPYFFMDEFTSEKWLEVNIDAVKIAKDMYPHERIMMQLVMGKDLLINQKLQEEIIDSVILAPADIIGLWIDDFDETSVTSTELMIYKKMLEKLGSKKQIIILYGSYFSVALMNALPDLNIIGVCHGLEYAEHRPVIPVGGGFPVSKFYYPSLHIRLPYMEAFTLARSFFSSKENYLHNVCNCKKCKELIAEANSVDEAFSKYGNGEPTIVRRKNQVVVINYPTTEARSLCVSHYMWCKEKEYNEEWDSPSQVADKLQLSADESMKIGNAFAGHCLRWAKVLRG
jgi:hypothetical protein